MKPREFWIHKDDIAEHYDGVETLALKPDADKIHNFVHVREVLQAAETTDVVLDHPCKNTCSGWQQGYERGLKASGEPVVPEFPLNLALAQIQKKLSNWNIPEATLGPMVLAAVSLTEWGFNRAIEMMTEARRGKT